MRVLKMLFIISALKLMCTSLPCFATSCPRYQAPGKFNNVPPVWGKTDSGVIVDGFLDLTKRDSTEIFDQMHGIDISSNNVIAYSRVKDCGGKFSFIRLDDSYAEHFRALRALDIVAIPYSYFRIPAVYRTARQYSDSPEGSKNLSEQLERFSALGAEAADKLIKRIATIPGGVPVINFNGLSAKIIAVDIEEKLLDEPNSSKKQRIAYGRSYARALCSWVQKMKSSDSKLLIFLYTMPAVYGDYFRYALRKDNECIVGLPVWLAHTTGDGGDSIYSSSRKAASSFSDESAQRLCAIPGGNRCVIHQYSHRATFASLGKSRKGTPTSVDVNRWFPVVAVESGVGYQYVRRDWIGNDAQPPKPFKKIKSN